MIGILASLAQQASLCKADVQQCMAVDKSWPVTTLSVTTASLAIIYMDTNSIWLIILAAAKLATSSAMEYAIIFQDALLLSSQTIALSASCATNNNVLWYHRKHAFAPMDFTLTRLLRVASKFVEMDWCLLSNAMMVIMTMGTAARLYAKLKLFTGASMEVQYQNPTVSMLPTTP